MAIPVVDEECNKLVSNDARLIFKVYGVYSGNKIVLVPSFATDREDNVQ